jgi:hypothetical protein
MKWLAEILDGLPDWLKAILVIGLVIRGFMLMVSLLKLALLFAVNQVLK